MGAELGARGALRARIGAGLDDGAVDRLVDGFGPSTDEGAHGEPRDFIGTDPVP